MLISSILFFHILNIGAAQTSPTTPTMSTMQTMPTMLTTPIKSTMPTIPIKPNTTTGVHEQKDDMGEIIPILYIEYLTFFSLKHYNISKRLILLSHDVELNPGPNHNKQNLTICTYNVNGIKDFKKLKRVTNFLNKLPFKNNCIINLQETHLTPKEG